MWNAVVKTLLAMMAAIVAMGCASVDPVVKIGLVAPFEGRDREIGYDALYSARLAVREINAAGGVAGHQLSLVALDDRGDPEMARQAAASLAIDPGVIAVVGHYLPEPTTVAEPIYEENGVPLIPLGRPPYTPFDPNTLPAAFSDAYAAVTPFDEIAGPFAGPTYDAIGLLREALAEAEETTGSVTRTSVQEALGRLKYEGLTGEVYLP